MGEAGRAKGAGQGGCIQPVCLPQTRFFFSVISSKLSSTLARYTPLHKRPALIPSRFFSKNVHNVLKGFTYRESFLRRLKQRPNENPTQSCGMYEPSPLKPHPTHPCPQYVGDAPTLTEDHSN